jgi:hypothetical protein
MKRDTDTPNTLFLKEFFTFMRVVATPFCWLGCGFVTEESVSLFQAGTDEQWGVDSSKLMKVMSIHNFDRHFQIARTTAYRVDQLFIGNYEWYAGEKTGNVQDSIDINDVEIKNMESYMRAAPPPMSEVPFFLSNRAAFVGVETHNQHLQPRRDLFSRFYEYAGINTVQQTEEGYRSSAEYAYFRATSKSSVDGFSHIYPEHATVSMIRAVLSLSKAAHTVEQSWLDDLPPADATTLHCTCIATVFATTARVLVAEVFEQHGRHADAIRFAQTDLQDYHNLNVVSKVRAGRVLGRCHAAIDLARSGKLLLSEALSVRGRAVAGKSGAGGSGLHWDEDMGKQRLVEVMGRMQGPREVLERVLGLP